MTDGTLRHALAFATAGWPVLPCLPGQKIPATAHGRPSADPGSRLAYPVHETGTNEQTTIVDMVCAEGQGTAVRIGAPARKHGVGDADILHAVRTAIRKIDMDDDLTMLIGRPAMARRWRSAYLT